MHNRFGKLLPSDGKNGFYCGKNIWSKIVFAGKNSFCHLTIPFCKETVKYHKVINNAIR